jgi:hypothetical protein
MNEEKEKTRDAEATDVLHPLHRVKLPGFIIEQDIGLGDVVKWATRTIGIKPCGGCEKRATALNRWMVLSR